MTAITDLRSAVEESGISFISHEKVTPATRALHLGVLQAFLDTGVAPELDWIQEQAARLRLEPEASLQQLAEADLVHVGSGTVVVAYPFSGVPTNDSVQLEGGPSLYAMCAIDALGILLMTDRDGLISSADPQSGAPIRVTRNASHWEWAPASTVVVAGIAPSCSVAAEACCPHVAFYASAEGADAYLAADPEFSGAVLDHAEAVEIADVAFGSLLGRSDSDSRS